MQKLIETIIRKIGPIQSEIRPANDGKAMYSFRTWKRVDGGAGGGTTQISVEATGASTDPIQALESLIKEYNEKLESIQGKVASLQKVEL